MYGNVNEMDVRTAVMDMANYSSIVTYFKNLKTFGGDDLVLLVDTIDNMSEEIFEHYKALCELCRGELQKLRRSFQKQGNFDFLEVPERRQLAYAVNKACGMGILLAEKYTEMAAALSYYM